MFDNEVPAAWRRDLFDLIRATPNLDWLLLTKRIGIAQRLFDEAHMDPPDGGSGYDWPANVWIGATIVNQAETDRDIPKLLSVPARVRFLSIEPMLGPINLVRGIGCKRCGGSGTMIVGDQEQECDSITNSGQHADSIGELLAGIDWVIVGGESGPKARPMHPDWPRGLRDQCAAAGVPFLFKQWGEHDMGYDRDRDDPDYRRCDTMDKLPGRWINLAGGHGFSGERVHYAHRVGTKAAGRLLDGVMHNEFPEVSR